ncbi:hypothetical protein [Hymenobacter lapidiphilus]|uniref:Phage portal protein n=1 Tax=Hymenobacter lapidiphilus TaxID=2608003 RepID=A0A7Y7PSL2_9BACT|nr:hypothetical protein [Hymenobacter lapidiphilus]NVO33280.1 hypothetical protein [Hymenobacter lapidiphilus]
MSTPARPARTISAAPAMRAFNMAVPPTLPAVVAVRGTATAPSGGKAIAYGEGDTAPQVCLDAALDSGTAYRALERRAQFLEGTGFPVPVTDPRAAGYDPSLLNTMGHTPVPGQPGKTANDLWSEWCGYGAYNNGAAALIRYAADATMEERYVVPFHAVRKTTKATFLLNHKIGRKGYRGADSTEHGAFDPRPEIIAAILELAEQPLKESAPDGPKHGQPGQILYAYAPRPGQEDYPYPPHYAGLEDVLTDAEYARFDYEEVRNGFFPSAMLTIIGEEDSTTKDANGDTQQDRTDAELRGFTGNNNSGTGRKKLFVMEAATKEQAPILTPFNGNTNVEKLIEKRDSIGQIVCRNIGIPPILCGFAKPGQLGATQELVNAAELTQRSLEPLRQLLLRSFLRIMPELVGLLPGQHSPVEIAKTVQATATPPTPAA